MKALIWSSSAGVLGIVKGKAEVFIPFPISPAELSQRLGALNRNEVIEEERRVADALSKKGFAQILSLKAVVSGPVKTEKIGSEELYGILSTSQSALKSAYIQNETLCTACIELSQKMLKEERKEKIIMQALGMHEDTSRILNVFHERLREWVILYNTETPKSTSNEQLVSLILSGGIENTGMEFDDADTKAIRQAAGAANGLADQKKYLESYLDALVKSETPNLHAVCGFLLAAKLLSISGGVEKLARSPASRIQLLGAEKALFRHMRDRTRSPKHGIILMHPLVNTAPRELKGKMARLLAARISLASKIDFFSRTDRGEEMRKQLQKDAAAIISHGGGHQMKSE